MRCADESDPLERLSRAIDAFLEHRADGGNDREFLTTHEDLRDILEPLMSSGALDQEEGDGSVRSNLPAERSYLGDYRLIREIGRGGMGIVYEAEQSSLKRRVALKVMPNHHAASPRRVERFRREAAALARLAHPGIVPIHEVGHAGGTHFYAMELVEGRTLQELLTHLRERRREDSTCELSLAVGPARSYAGEVAELVAQVAEALHYAHEHGVVHRDVKPDNLLVTDEGEVLLADFGLSKDLDRTSLTRTGEFSGTLPYMSPEQLRQGEIDPRSDVFSLGAVLYELLTLEPAFDGPSLEHIMAAVEKADPRPLRSLPCKVPRDLEVICSKALEKDVGHRYQSAADLAADLRRFLHFVPIEARPAGPATRLFKFVRRHKVGTSALVLASLMLIAAPIVYAVFLKIQNERHRERRDLDLKRTEELRVFANRLLTICSRSELGLIPGRAHYASHQIEEALALHEEVHAFDPANQEAQNGLCRALITAGIHAFRLGRRPRAIEILTRAIAFELPDRAQAAQSETVFAAWFERAAAYLNRHFARREMLDPKAFEDLEQTLALLGDLQGLCPARYESELHIRTAWAEVSRAYWLRRQGDPRNALAACTRAEEAWARAQVDETSEVKEDVRRRRLEGLLERGRARAELGQIDPAITDLQDVLARAQRLARDSRSPYVKELLARTSFELYKLGRDRFQVDERERLLELALTTQGKLAEDHADHPGFGWQRIAMEMHVVGEELARDLASPRGAHLIEQTHARAKQLFECKPRTPSFEKQYVYVVRFLALARARRQTPPGKMAVGPLYEHGIEIGRRLCNEIPDDHECWSSLGALLGNYADWSLRNDEPRRALDLLAEAIRVQTRALEANEGYHQARHFLQIHYGVQIRALLATRQANRVLAVARRRVALFPDTPGILGSTAAFLALAAEARTRSDPETILESREAEQSIAWLRHMHEVGGDLTLVLRARSLRALRRRQDFQELCQVIREDQAR